LPRRASDSVCGKSMCRVSCWTVAHSVDSRYIGKLQNGKQFDANTSGQPFYFRLGAGEVIKGWDQGLDGMAVGGERKLTVSTEYEIGVLRALVSDCLLYRSRPSLPTDRKRSQESPLTALSSSR
jgi:hypothetical protein